jgi:tRNA threonylcarbamoyladenosine biosynthesis protein TsaE
MGVRGLDEAELTAWGERVGAEVEAPVVLALRGGLGAGKSVLARAVARGAGVTGALPSPTFNLVYRYQAARLPGGPGRGGAWDEEGVEVWHLDLYRLEDPEEVWELGWRERGSDRQIVLIEWPERAEALLPPVRWDISLEPGEREGERVVRLERHGEAPELPELPVAGAASGPGESEGAGVAGELGAGPAGSAEERPAQ